MTRIVILGGPRTGKTTLARELWSEQVNGRTSSADPVAIRLHSDDIMHMGWSEASEHVARDWLSAPGPWIIEGVALSRALRKWREAHPGEPPPVDKIIRLTTPYVELEGGQIAMMKGEHTVWSRDVEPWLRQHGVSIEHGPITPAHQHPRTIDAP
jgi:hypothetical protein